MRVKTNSGMVEVDEVSPNRWNVHLVNTGKHLGYVHKRDGEFYGIPFGRASQSCDSLADAALYVGE